MAQMKVPDAPREYATQYHDLLGVDYQADQTEVDRTRSPEMINMISDFGGNPVKRDGYRVVGAGYSAIVMVDNKMYGVRATTSLVVIAELELDGYTFRTIETHYLNMDIGAISSVFVYQKHIYIMASHAMVRFDTLENEGVAVGTTDGLMSQGNVGETAPAFDDNIPITVITLNPDGTGGTAYYDKNILTIYQQVMFKGNGTAREYIIPTYKKMGTWVKAEVKNPNTGDWETATVTVGASEQVNGKTLDGTGTMQSYIVDAKVTFATAPPTVAGGGEDNVRITFAPYSMDWADEENQIYKGYYNETFVNVLSSGITLLQNGRFFVADKYRVYYSDVNEPYRLSDLSWFDVDNEIMCFTSTSNYLAVITRDNGRNTIFLASEATRTIDSTTGETETYFAVKASNAGIGAIAKKCIATLSDEPMFLSNTGVFGILTNWQSEKYAINRSSRINRRLCKERNLETAVAIAWNDYYWLAVNGKMYVLDGRHRENDRAGNKPLEAYYFDRLPVVTDMYVVGDKMYFTDGEDTYTWNEDLTDTDRYYDNGHLVTVVQVQYQIGTDYVNVPTGEWLDEIPELEEGDVLWYSARYSDNSIEATTEETVIGDTKWTGNPVCAKWCSAFDDDGAPQKLKTYMKKGSMITIVPHYKSGCEITLVKDGDVYEYLGSFDADMQSFESIDFSRFTFSSNSVAFDKFTKKKIKKYKRLQIQVENNKAEPFGITKIVKTYTFGNYAKR